MERSSMIWMVEYLLNSAWQAPLVLLVALLAGRLMAPLHSVAASHRIWVAAVALATLLPAFRINAWPGIWWWHAATITGGRVQVTMLPGAAVTAGNLPLSPATMAVLLTLYAVITFYFAGRIAWGLWKAETLRRNAFAPLLPVPLQLRWEALCAWFGVTHAALRVSPAVSGPAVVGSRTILLPAEFLAKVRERDLDAALAHELAHVQRRDCLKNIAYALLTLPVAYHPCAWLLRKHLAESRESICDAMAAGALDGKRGYARSLLRLAMAMPAGLRGRPTMAVGIFDRNTLERRVGIMLHEGKQLRGAKRFAAMTAVLLLAAAGAVSMAGTHLIVRAADNTAGKHRVLQVSAAAMMGNLRKKVAPKYPEEAKAHHNALNGTITLEAIINKKGVPTNIYIIKSLRKDYDESALDAVSQWRWKPYLLNEEPVAVKTTVKVTYSLNP